MSGLFNITFAGTEELAKLAQEQAKLLRQNAETAVANTTLFGIAKIANDCPTDTGRLRASIAGEYGGFGSAGVVDTQLKRGKIGEGRSQSTTKIDRKNMEGRIGTNVEYALHVEYGHAATGPKKLTPKQLRYLFAIGVLKTDKNGKVVPSIHSRINRRADMKYGVNIRDRGRYRVKGKGFFRKNIPIVERHFHQTLNQAIDATSEGRLLREQG